MASCSSDERASERCTEWERGTQTEAGRKGKKGRGKEEEEEAARDGVGGGREEGRDLQTRGWLLVFI